MANKSEIQSAHKMLMGELAKALVNKRAEYVDMLNESGIFATMDMTDGELVDLFVDNVPNNKDLAIAASMLVNMNSNNINFSGNDDSKIKNDYKTIMAYYSTDNETAEDFSSLDDFSEFSDSNEDSFLATVNPEIYEGHSYLDPTTVGSISGAVQGLSQTGTAGIEALRARRESKASSVAKRQAEARMQLKQQLASQRGAELESKQRNKEQQQKTIRTALLVVGGLIAATILTIVIVKAKKK